MNSQSPLSRCISLFAFVVFASSVGVNVLQAKRIRDLVNPEPVKQRLGQRVDVLNGVGLDGTAATIEFSSRPTVLYFFSSTCRWCEKNWQNVRSLQQAAGERYRFVGVATETNLRPFADAHGLTFELVGGVAPAILQTLKLSATPQTLVVSSNGVITHEWVGAFTGRTQREIEELFGLSLPGLLSVSTPRPEDRP